MSLIARGKHAALTMSLAPFLAFPLVMLLVVSSQAEEPLRVRIDQLIDQGHIGQVADSASDADFLRRVYLDWTGAIPTSEEARKFLDDPSPDKRTKLIDHLLDSKEFVRRMATQFDLMLMERRADKHVKSGEWSEYLRASVEQNKPYNQLAAEILGADGADPKGRAAAKFFLDREASPDLLTREVGRMFFGMDLECAQCHDHPLIDDYLQADYYGVQAFVSRTYLFQPDKKKPAVLAEKAEGVVKFKSVFTDEEGVTRPRLPGASEIDEPSFKKGEEYQVKPDPKKKTLRPIPKYSRRARLAQLATDGSNAAFNRNIVNRLWAMMMGRGLVHPVDLHHTGNPPTHPELLDLLADEFVKMKFDVKALLRELALTKTYQRSGELASDLTPRFAAARGMAPAAETAVVQSREAASRIAKKLEVSEAALEVAQQTAAPLTEALKKAQAALTPLQKAAAESAKVQAESQSQLAAKQAVVLA
ncbi:MAG: DUF1549 domain-containing protein, partial [Planctomycetales bacterium]